MYPSAAIYKERRARLRAMLASLSEQDTIVLCAAAEPRNSRFRQDSTFYYFTGIDEPAAVLCMEGNGDEWLYVPSYNGMRSQWVSHEITTETDPAIYGVTEIRYQGGVVGGYMVRPFTHDAVCAELITYLVRRAAGHGSLYVAGMARWFGDYPQQMLWYLGQQIPHFTEKLIDINALIATMRRRKDPYELSCISGAIARTASAQQIARTLMQAGRKECEIRAAIDAEFVRQGSPIEAFPSIVATGVNATILHYIDEKAVLQDGEAVVVDIGATYECYAADITRTYPVGGAFTSRQRELYQIVLDTQHYIASCAKPGMYNNNRFDPEHSLNHLAKAYLDRFDLGRYMPHSIGHFMGLDVHDVGDPMVPLMPGDVITIEPGVYIAGERIGIRIEDDYLITTTGAECLSSEIPKELTEIEG